MLKTTGFSDLPSSDKNKNNGKIVRFDVGNASKVVNKLRKLKSKKLSKFQKMFRSKKLLKSGNTPKFSTKKAKSNFLTSGTSKSFNW